MVVAWQDGDDDGMEENPTDVDHVVERGAPLCWDLHFTYTYGIFPSLTTLVPSS